MLPLCIHTITTQPWSAEECIRHYAAAGIAGITFWRYSLEGRDVVQLGNQARDAGLQIVSLCRGGFFPAKTPLERLKAVDDNRICIQQAYELGAPKIVLVCGAVPGQDLATSRHQIADGIAAILPDAQAAGVTLAIEPLHPMYADNRSAVNTLRQAHEICDELGSPKNLGIAVDAYHTWWDGELHDMIKLAGQKHRLTAYHLCDWKTPTTDLLNDRGIMGEGCIPLKQMATWVREAGFQGLHEVEIFSQQYWGMDQHIYLKKIVEAWRALEA
jgi:sugar phosphate isomerase/epimerase